MPKGGDAPRTATPVPRGQLVDHVLRRMADDIVLGRLAPGLHLDEQAMAARYQVSRTPVREALKLLVASGLADYRPNRGSVVRQLDSAELDLMFEAIAELESACARHAALRLTQAERQQLLQAHAEGRQAMQAHDMEAYDRANQRLHQIILEGAHNPYLIDTTRTLRSRVMAFRRGQFTRLDRLVQSYEEHSRLVEALLAHDALAAHREMRSHLLSARHATSLLAPQWRDEPALP
ncbi:GntR family transcriptional regulator [Curvibacter sp. HBC61]|uniref:GntR family transcriptional regulator n=1 Tax=Curvibacter cyanobacteriorum TaxID=3026422 RepID=A0ABT5N2N2_9BURK|nr:GntR family transcriptional regulator [Curvibacter sp. HBC61]MDD0840573.1 GntR family transcriptional regulator [Curvibacter sp. HBC61]